MNNIKTYEGFFDWFKGKKSEEDKIIFDFIKRLRKVNGISPYEIKLNTEGTEEGEQYWTSYEVIFDDVPIKITKIESDKKYRLGWSDDAQEEWISEGRVKKNNHIFYSLWLEYLEERLSGSVDIMEELFELTDKVYKEDVRARRIKRIRDEMNPAADKISDTDN